MIVCSQCLETSVARDKCDVCNAPLTDCLVLPRLEDEFILDAAPPLGAGSFAEVVSAKRRSDGTPWAVKLVNLKRASESARVRLQLRASFLREASALSILHHPHIIRVVSYGARDPDTPYMAMELLPHGQTLQGALQKGAARGKSPGLNTVLRVLEEIGGALAYVHTQSIIHRDVKPGNIGIDANKRFKLLDFGLLKYVEEGFDSRQGALTVAGWGSYNYGAPEQFFGGDVGPWTDVYSLGAVAYELLCGRPPVMNGSVDRILEAMQRPAEPLPANFTRPEALERLVMSMVAKAATQRPQTMAAVLDEVRTIRRALRRATAEQGQATQAPAGQRLASQRSVTPVPRVTVIRTRRGDETRPADDRALAALNVLRDEARAAEVSPGDSLEEFMASASGERLAPVGPDRVDGETVESADSPLIHVPKRPWLLPLAGIGALLVGAVGLWLRLQSP